MKDDASALCHKSRMPLAPPVGVVIANYNNCAFVERAIESVARQTARNLRVVIVDDGSTDASDEAIQCCLARLGDDRFRYVKLETNLGQGGAVKRGMEELDTPFICFLDSDDLWYEGFVARHLAVHMNTDFPVALTYCDSQIIDGEDRLLAGTAWFFDANEPDAKSKRAIPPSLIPAYDPATGQLIYPRHPGVTFHPQWSAASATNTTASMMFRRAFVELVLVLPSQELRLYLDYYLATFASLLTGAIAIHEALYGYRMHGKNIHSNATVLGGAYNSSMREWDPIRLDTLRKIQAVLRQKSDTIRLAFSQERHDIAVALLAEALGDPPADAPPARNGWLPDGVRTLLNGGASGKGPHKRS